MCMVMTNNHVLSVHSLECEIKQVDQESQEGLMGFIIPAWKNISAAHSQRIKILNGSLFFIFDVNELRIEATMCWLWCSLVVASKKTL